MIRLLWLLLIAFFSIRAEELLAESAKVNIHVSYQLYYFQELACEEIKETDQDNPYGPLIPCSHLPDEFITCTQLELSGPNHNASEVCI